MRGSGARFLGHSGQFYGVFFGAKERDKIILCAWAKLVLGLLLDFEALKVKSSLNSSLKTSLVLQGVPRKAGLSIMHTISN